jgi:hypothetical protein
VESVNKSYYCPACGFLLDFEPWSNESPSDEICPCCGIQFGYDDAAGGNMQRRSELYQEWRRDWIAKGMPWRSEGAPAPRDWNPGKQLDDFLNC